MITIISDEDFKKLQFDLGVRVQYSDCRFGGITFSGIKETGVSKGIIVSASSVEHLLIERESEIERAELIYTVKAQILAELKK